MVGCLPRPSIVFLTVGPFPANSPRPALLLALPRIRLTMCGTHKIYLSLRIATYDWTGSCPTGGMRARAKLETDNLCQPFCLSQHVMG